MLSEDPTRVRDVLRSCEVAEIGGRLDPAPDAATKRPPAAEVMVAFAAIYLIWGSTYLGIRYAIETIPPLIMMGLRHLTAGTLLYAWQRWRGVPRPKPAQWAYAAVAGVIFFLGSHGSLAWAEQKVPSGLAALLCATLPLWVVVLAWLRGIERHPGRRAVTGLLLGFAGVGLLIGPQGLRESGQTDWWSAGVVLMGAFLWAVGSIYSKRAKLPASSGLSAAMQMISGGTALLLAGAASGEGAQFHTAGVSLKSAAALAYLIIFGSIIAFSAFTWLMTTSSASRVSTYAYVNPVVAVLVGWALAGETMGIRTLIAAGIILAGVVLVTTKGNRQRVPLPVTGARELQVEAGD